MRPSACFVLLALAACQRSPDLRVDGSTPAAPPSSAAASPAPSPASASAFAIADGASETFRGAIAGSLAVVMTLARRGSTLEGTYFYEKNGGEIALKGAVLPSGEFSLEERAEGKTTGRFKGRADRAALAGEWFAEGAGSAASGRAFLLAPIARTADGPLMVFKKKLRTVRKAGAPNEAAQIKDCTVDAQFIGAYGARSAEIDDAINRALRPTPKELGEGEACDVAESYSMSSQVVLNERGVLSLVSEREWCCGAHPSYSRHHFNVATDTGAPFKLDEVFASRDAKKLVPLVRPVVAKRFGEADDERGPSAIDEAIAEVLRGRVDFNVTSKGLALSLFNTQPHVIQSMFSDPFVVPWSKLAPLLDAKGSLRAFAKPAP